MVDDLAIRTSRRRVCDGARLNCLLRLRGGGHLEGGAGRYNGRRSSREGHGGVGHVCCPRLALDDETVDLFDGLSGPADGGSIWSRTDVVRWLSSLRCYIPQYTFRRHRCIVYGKIPLA